MQLVRVAQETATLVLLLVLVQEPLCKMTAYFSTFLVNFNLLGFFSYQSSLEDRLILYLETSRANRARGSFGMQNH